MVILNYVSFLNVIYMVSCGLVTEYSKTDEVIRFPAEDSPMKFTYMCRHPLEYELQVTCLEGKDVPEHKMMIVSMAGIAVERFSVTSCTKDLIYTSYYLPWAVVSLTLLKGFEFHITYEFFILFVNSDEKCFKRQYRVCPDDNHVSRLDAKPVSCPCKFMRAIRFNHFRECTDLQNPAPLDDGGNQKLHTGKLEIVTDFSRTDDVINYEVKVKNYQGAVVDLPMKRTFECTHPIERDFKITCLVGQDNSNFKIMVVSLKDILVERFTVTSCSKSGVQSSFYLPWSVYTSTNFKGDVAYDSYEVFIKFFNSEGKFFKREYEVCPTMEPKTIRQDAKEIIRKFYWDRGVMYSHFSVCKNL